MSSQTDGNWFEGARAIIIGSFAVVIPIFWLSGEFKDWSALRLLTIVGGVSFLSAGGIVRHFQLIGDEAAEGAHSALLFAVAFLFLGVYVFFWPRPGDDLAGKIFGAAYFLFAMGYLTYRLIRRPRAGTP